MSAMSTGLPALESSDHSDHGLPMGDMGAEDDTPRSEAPPSFNLMPPGLRQSFSPPATTTTAAAATTVPDYFTTPSVAGTNVPAYDFHARETDTPSASVTDATASGHILPPDPPSLLQPPERPAPHTAVSSLSIESTISSATVTPGPLHLPFPDYPNQAYSALHSQHYPPPYRPSNLRRGTQPHQISTFASAIASLHSSGTRSAYPSPAIAPNIGLFGGSGPGSAPAPASSEGSGTYASPFLHFTHTHVPKETHVADVDVDPVSGRKLINHYEIIDELGRGTHGKVKLGRDLESPATNPTYVAIKIVERFSKRRKLGRLGTTEDKVKKEVAVLKKARHPNVVALLEVIDDPSRKKVYIVLEWVERGEISWRVKGPKEIAMVEARRYEREKQGLQSETALAEDLAVFNEAHRRLSRRRRRELKEYRLRNRGLADNPDAWSMELAGETESEGSEDDRLSRISSITAHSDTGMIVMDQGGYQLSRTPSPLQPSDGVEASYLSLTPEPEAMSPLAVERESQDGRRPLSGWSMTALAGTMYGPYDFFHSQTSRAASLNSLTSPWGSSDNLARHATEILDSHLDSELEYVPVMAMEQIRIAFRDTLLGLQYLHYQGIVHRDIKPPNLLATIDNRFKISDFGVSYLGRPVQEGEQEDVSEAEAHDLDGEAKELAKTVGTPAFYAPELCSTDPTDDPMPVTKAIDVWALGVTLFCMLFARTPFVDNEYVVMRQIADEEIHVPQRRLQPVDNKPKSRSSSRSRASTAAQTGRRHELELAYEAIDDTLHDLLKRLLTKDPRKRITLEEVRHHPWVLADLPNKLKWLEETDLSRQTQGKKIEISREEMNTAVVPLNLVERMRSGLKKVLDKTGITRTRAHSNAGSAPKEGSPSPSANSSSTAINQDDRRRSILADEALFTALKATHSLDAEHRLSRSVVATPEIEKNRVGYAAAGANVNLEFPIELSRTTPRTEPLLRGNIVASAAGSMRTVKQSDYQKDVYEDSPPRSPALPASPMTHTPGTRGLSGLLGGTSHLIRTVRERSSQRRIRSRDPSIDGAFGQSGDAHGEATLAVSQATASGLVHAVDLRRDCTPSPSVYDGPASSRPHSELADPPHHLQPAEPGTLSRLSSSSSITSLGRRVGNAFRSSTPRSESRRTSADEWKRADEERVRKLVRESQQVRAGPVLPDHHFDSPEILEEQACPPSPDDLTDKGDETRLPSMFASSNPETPPDSISPTNQTGSLPPALASSSSDLGSAVSMSVSNPSIPSVISEASSVDFGDDGRYEYFNEVKHDPFSDNTLNSDSEARQEVQDIQEAYDDDHDQGIALDSEHDDDFDSSSGSDGGLVMRRKTSGRHALTMAANSTKERRGTGLSFRSKKSVRSGSNNTMKKVRTRENGEDRRSLEISEE